MKNNTNDIVEKATTVFMQNGLQSVSMDDVALYCCISKKTLSETFQSKEILLETIVQKLISKTAKYSRLCPDISPNAIKEIENSSEHIPGMLEILTPKFIRDLRKYYPEAYTPVGCFQRQFDNTLSQKLFKPWDNRRNFQT